MLLLQIAEKPYLHTYCENKLNLHIPLKNVYINLHSIFDNRYKQFRYKLINNIIPTGENLFKWKIKNTDKCFICDRTDSIEHLFIHCKSVENYWKRITDTFKSIKIFKEICNIRNIVLGYSFEHHKQNLNIWQLNLIFNIIGFSIYKAYIISNQRTEDMNVISIFLKEIYKTKEYFDFKKEKRHILDNFISLFNR